MISGHQNNQMNHKDGNSQYNLENKDISMSDCEPSSAMSLNSDKSKQSRSLLALTKQFKKTHHSRQFRRIIRKLKNQKRLSRSIEKIFISKKEERTPSEINGDPLLIKPTKEIENPIPETNVVAKQNNVSDSKIASPENLKTQDEIKNKVCKIS